MTAHTHDHGLPDSGDRTPQFGGAMRDRPPGKGRFDLISPFFLKDLAVLLEQGAAKYAVRNWERGYSLPLCLDSAGRHLQALQTGDTSEDHMLAVAWNAMAFIHIRRMILSGSLPLGLAAGYVPLHVRNPVTDRVERAEDYDEDGNSLLMNEYLPQPPETDAPSVGGGAPWHGPFERTQRGDAYGDSPTVEDYVRATAQGLGVDPDAAVSGWKESVSPTEKEPESPLVAHARRELNIAGLLDEDSDYDGMLGRAALDLVKMFAGQGHSGASAFVTIDLTKRLMSYEPLTPLTADPTEWSLVAEEMSNGEDLWQNRRDSRAFSNDGGKTYRRNGEKNVLHTSERTPRGDAYDAAMRGKS
jgi:hypothetical protein